MTEKREARTHTCHSFQNMRKNEHLGSSTIIPLCLEIHHSERVRERKRGRVKINERREKEEKGKMGSRWMKQYG